MSCKTASVAFIIASILSSHSAEAQPLSQYICNFTHGVVVNLETEFSEPDSTDERMLLIFQNLNFGTNTAQMIGNSGGGPVSVHYIEAAQSVSFFEVTPSGNVTTTTLFKKPSGTILATHSRHIAIDRIPPIVSQYYGSCTRN